ncbi:MAG: hypothetical protein ACPGRZ_05060 [Alphaproteobacteria bacterium]
MTEFHNKCVKKGACGAKGQRPCLLTERLPSCNKGLAEDFKTQKCNPPKSAAQVCEDVLTALTHNKPIPVLERLKREKDRLIKKASDKSGLTKVENSLKKNLSHAFKIKKFEPFRREVSDLMKQVRARVDDIKKELLAPHPFCFDSGAKRLAKLQKMKLLPNFGFKKKAGLLDGLLISKAHAAVPAAHFWGLSLTGSKSTGAKRGAITVETIFRKDMKTGENKVVSVIVQPSYPLGLGADPLSFCLGYTYYGQEQRTGPADDRLTAKSFQGISIPSLGWGVGVPLSGIVKFLGPDLDEIKEGANNFRWIAFDFGFPFPLNISISKNLKKVTVSPNLIPESIGVSAQLYPKIDEDDNSGGFSADLGLFGYGFKE